MVQVNAGSIEARILKVLLEKYPVDTVEILEMTHLGKQEVERALRGMEDRGWLMIERLPERSFIRLRRFDFTFLGRDETQRKAVKHRSKDRKKKKIKQALLQEDHDDNMMYH